MYIIYGIPNCLYCSKTKQLLDDMKIQYTYHVIQTDKTEFLNNMSSKTNNQRTFPLIFYNDDFIGGFMELDDYLAFQ